MKVAGSYNGLVCLYDYGDGVIWNPVLTWTYKGNATSPNMGK